MDSERGEPTHARASSTWERAVKWARRRPALAALAGVSAVAAAALLIMGLVYNARLQVALGKAADAETNAARHEQAAERERQAAQTAKAGVRQSDAHAEGLRLIGESAVVRPDNPGLALLLAVEGAQRGRPRTATHNNALLAALADCREQRTLILPQPKPQTGPSHRFGLTSARFSTDGRWIVTTAEGFGPFRSSHDVGIEGSAQVWEAATGRLLVALQAARGQYFDCVQLSPDGRVLVTTFSHSALVRYAGGDKCLYTDRVARVWEAATGKELRVLRGHTNRVVSACFSPDGRRVVTASWDRTARVWDPATGRELAVLRAGEFSLDAAVFSADGRRVLTLCSGASKHIHYPDGPGGMLPATVKVDPPVRAHEAVADVQLGQSGSGAVGPGEKQARPALWDADTGKKVPLLGDAKTTFTQEATTCAAFSTDGRRCVAGSRQGAVAVWDAHNGKLLLRFQGRRQPLRSITSSANDRRLVLVYDNNTVAVWDAVTGKELAVWQGAAAHVSAVISRDGGRVFICPERQKSEPWQIPSNDSQQPDVPEARTVSVRDVASGKEVASLKGHEDDITAACLSPDGGRLVTASLDGTARVWEAGAGASFATVFEGAGPARAALFSPDGRYLLVANARAYQRDAWDSFARIREASTGWTVAVLKGQGRPDASRFVKQGLGGVRGVEYSPDGKRVLTVSDDTQVRILKAGVSDNALFATPMDKWPVAEVLPFTPVRVWDAGTGRELLGLKGLSSRVDFASFSPDGGRILTIAQDQEHYCYLHPKTGVVKSSESRLSREPDVRQVRIWDATTGKLLRILENPLHQECRGATWSPDGRWIATPSRFTMWDAETGEPLFPLKAAGGALHAADMATFSPDGRYLAAITRHVLNDQETALLWDFSSGVNAVARLTGHEGSIQSATFSPDSRWLVTTSADRTARTWEVATGKQWFVLRGHPRAVTSAAFSRDGRWLVTASDDWTARIWDVATGKEWFTLKGHQGPVTSAVFSPDGRQVLTASADGTARLWPVDPLPAALARKPRELTREERELFGIRSSRR
ncbi:MAG TPA: WD40 repeat domain-containing protein [Gemmataceae bacterium]|nr:WD40 repeat domain-containing protein [Gemmataceae bacterium]